MESLIRVHSLFSSFKTMFLVAGIFISVPRSQEKHVLSSICQLSPCQNFPASCKPQQTKFSLLSLTSQFNNWAWSKVLIWTFSRRGRGGGGGGRKKGSGCGEKKLLINDYETFFPGFNLPHPWQEYFPDRSHLIIHLSHPASKPLRNPSVGCP